MKAFTNTTCLVSYLLAAALLMQVSSYGQAIDSLKERQFGTIWFEANNIALTGKAKTTLDSLAEMLNKTANLHLVAVTYTRDFCDSCEVLSWDRQSTIASYLIKKGVASNKMNGTSRPGVNPDKVDLFLTNRQNNKPTELHPNLRKSAGTN